MEICFVGVGAAWEPGLGNASVLVKAQSQLLIDCGFGVPARLFEVPGFEDIDAVYLTHFHGDHTFGIPCLLGCLWELGREKKLTFIGQPGTQKIVEKMMQLAYPTLLKRIAFPIEYIESKEEAELNEFKLRFARSAHPQQNYAIKVSADDTSVGVSGDGAITPETQELFQDCSVIVHECYRYEDEVPGHGIATILFDSLKIHPNLKTLCLTHLDPKARRTEKDQMLALGERYSFDVYVPEPGDLLLV